MCFVIWVEALEIKTLKIPSICLRIIIHGENFARGIVPNSAGAFNFAEEYRLTEEQVRVIQICKGYLRGRAITRSQSQM